MKDQQEIDELRRLAEVDDDGLVSPVPARTRNSKYGLHVTIDRTGDEIS